MLTRPVNLAGLPALAIPSGTSSEGLPLGTQLIGGPGSEGLLLETGALLERLDVRFRVQTAPWPPPDSPNEG